MHFCLILTKTGVDSFKLTNTHGGQNLQYEFTVGTKFEIVNNDQEKIECSPKWEQNKTGNMVLAIVTRKIDGNFLLFSSCLLSS